MKKPTSKQQKIRAAVSDLLQDSTSAQDRIPEVAEVHGLESCDYAELERLVLAAIEDAAEDF